MRLLEIRARDTPPIRNFSADQLSDIVVLAGPNGVGKTRLVEAILQCFQNPHSYSGAEARVALLIDATCPTETSEWGKAQLRTEDAADAQLLIATLKKAKRRNNWESSVLNFESDRTIQRIEPLNFTWDFQDPWIENIGWNLGFGGLRDRFQDTLHSLFRKVRSRREGIAQRVEDLLRESKATKSSTPSSLFDQLEQEYPDPIEVFKQAFSQLLSPKTLVDPDPKSQQLRYSINGEAFPISSLSSGEREVVNIVFDFLLRSPSDCIVLFDEPELHLHPELSYKLLQTLATVGKNNQFIFCTHSPDIITASLDNTVVFVSPPKPDGSNQAIRVKEDDDTNQALKLLGQSIGIVALGKKLVLIEGAQSSLDKQTYGAILKGRFPDLVLVPAGGRSVVTSFAVLQRDILERTVWGVEFFMVCDRDAGPTGREASDAAQSARLKFLSRYHLENYFLDEHVLASVFEDMEPEGSPLRSPVEIRATLRTIAGTLVSYASALTTSAYFREQVGNLSIMPKDCVGKTTNQLVAMLTEKAQSERERMEAALLTEEIEKYTRHVATAIEQSLHQDNDDWKAMVPGKQVLSLFARKANLDAGRLKTMYIKRSESRTPNPFQDVIDIFAKFNNL